MLAAGGTKHHCELLAPFGLDAQRPGLLADRPLADRAHDRRAGGDGLTADAAGWPERSLSASVFGGGTAAARPVTQDCPPPDSEANRFSARARALCARRRQCRAASRRASPAGGSSASSGGGAGNAAALTRALGGLKGPIMKVAQLMATIPGPAAARIRGRAAEAAERRAAHGRGLREAAHAGRARRRLAAAVRQLRAHAGGRRLARPGASRAGARRRAPRLQAAVSRHAIGRGGRPAAAANGCSPSIAAWIRPSTRARSPRRSARACARSSTTARGQARRRSTRAMLGRLREVRVPRRLAGAVDRPAADARLARRHAAARPQGRPISRSATASRRRCSRRGGYPFRSFGVIHGDPASRQLHGVRRKGARASAAGRHQPAGLRLHPHLPAELRRRRGGPLSRAAARTTRRASSTPMRPGASSGSARADRHAQHLGAVHLRAAAGGPGAHASPTA